jgi:hypothetical protein
MTDTRQLSSTSAVRYLRHGAYAALILLLLLMTVRAAFGLSITSINAPATIHEGQVLNISFATDLPADYQILNDGFPVSASDSYSRFIGYDENGLSTFVFEATLENTSVNETRTIEVLDTPLVITVQEPAATDYAGEVPVSITTNIPAELCYVVEAEMTKTLDTVDNSRFNGTIALPDGVHTLLLKCKRSAELAEMSRTLKVDATAPIATLSPSGNVDESPVKLTATTDELSTCRYGTTERPFEEMTPFPQSGSLTHIAQLSLASGSYRYVVICQDLFGNQASAAATTFTLREKPTATVVVEGRNPHKAGSYKVTLEVSKQLPTIPTLTLAYQDGASSTLALQQAGDRAYEGYLIVEENAGERIGSFSFHGTDADGQEGTVITSGSLFMVDTVKPAKVIAFRAVNETKAVNLTWYFDSEEGVLFNIYRSTESGVTYTDLLGTTSGNSYRDFDVSDAVTYYYRIAAVDEAGNVGEISGEEWASPAAAQHTAERMDVLLAPVLQIGLDEHLSRLVTLTLDAKRAVQTLGDETDKARSGVIRDLGLLDAAQRSAQTFADATKRFEELRSLSLTKEEFDARVTQIERDIETARAALPLSIDVLNQVEYDETPDENAMDAVLTRTLSAKTISASEREASLQQMRDLQAGTRIATSVLHAQVRYADGLDQKYTLVRKRITAQEPRTDVLAIETIAKGVAAKASDIQFIGAQPIVLEEDPVVQFSFAELKDETIMYAVKGLIDPAVARASSLVLVPKQRNSADATASAAMPPDANPTSLSGNTVLSSLAGGQGLVILLGAVIIAGLLLYYFKLQNEPAAELFPFGASPYGASSSPIVVAQQAMQPLTRTVLVTRKEEPLAGLLLKGHTLIDENKYVDALYFYKAALTRYPEEPFPGPELKNAVRHELELLHAKLSLFDAMTKGHDSAYAGDAQGLLNHMERMRSFAARVGENETALIAKARAEYLYLYEQLSALNAERHHALAEETVVAA